MVEEKIGFEEEVWNKGKTIEELKYAKVIEYEDKFFVMDREQQTIQDETKDKGEAIQYALGYNEDGLKNEET